MGMMGAKPHDLTEAQCPVRTDLPRLEELANQPDIRCLLTERKHDTVASQSAIHVGKWLDQAFLSMKVRQGNLSSDGPAR